MADCSDVTALFWMQDEVYFTTTAGRVVVILSQSTDLFNGQNYLKVYTFDLTLNVPYITTMFYLLKF